MSEDVNVRSLEKGCSSLEIIGTRPQWKCSEVSGTLKPGPRDFVASNGEVFSPLHCNGSVP